MKHYLCDKNHSYTLLASLVSQLLEALYIYVLIRKRMYQYSFS